MRAWSVVVSLAAWCGVASAEQTLQEISWAELKQAGKLEAGEVVEEDQLRVTHPGDEPTSVTILTLRSPGVTTATYAITGRVRCEGVEGTGYLELWTFYPDGGRWFSRTLADRGPMKRLSGTSGWRRFVLPLRAKAATPAPQRLVLNVVLPGRGTVVVGPVRLAQYEAGEDPLAAPGQWWSERMGGVIGGGLGALIGCLGGLVGLLASRGKARGLVLGILRAVPILGVACLAGGVVALVQSQPYGVYYPLLLLGILGSALPLGMMRWVRRRYEELELRSMAAQDIS